MDPSCWPGSIHVSVNTILCFLRKLVWILHVGQDPSGWPGSIHVSVNTILCFLRKPVWILHVGQKVAYLYLS